MKSWTCVLISEQTTQDSYTGAAVINSPALRAPPFDKGGKGEFCQQLQTQMYYVMCFNLARLHCRQYIATHPSRFRDVEQSTYCGGERENMSVLYP